jgi:hypothetical protein
MELRAWINSNTVSSTPHKTPSEKLTACRVLSHICLQKHSAQFTISTVHITATESSSTDSTQRTWSFEAHALRQRVGQFLVSVCSRGSQRNDNNSRALSWLPTLESLFASSPSLCTNHTLAVLQNLEYRYIWKKLQQRVLQNWGKKKHSTVYSVYRVVDKIPILFWTSFGHNFHQLGYLVVEIQYTFVIVHIPYKFVSYVVSWILGSLVNYLVGDWGNIRTRGDMFWSNLFKWNLYFIFCYIVV